MEEKIKDILQSVLEIECVEPDCSQDNCEAWDSMAQLNLVLELEDAFSITLEPEDIAAMKNLRAVTETVRRKCQA